MPVRFEEERPSKVRFEEDAKAGLAPEQSALYGAGQGLTFGYSDELMAGGKALYDKFSKGGELSDLYRQRIDAERKALDEAQRDNPKSYYGGLVAGSLPTMAIPGLGIAKGASLGTALGRAALQGGLMASGESVSNPFGSAQEAKQFLGDTAKGAATGAAFQGAFSGLGNLFNKMTPSSLKQTAAERAVKATTGQNISALRKMTNTTLNSAGDVKKMEDGLRKVGRDIMDEGSLGALDQVEDLAPKLAKGRQKYGEMIGEVGKQIDEIMPEAVDAKKISDDLLNYASSIPETEAGKKLQERVLAEAANFEKMGKMPFGKAQEFKNQFKYKPTDADALISSQDATNKIRSIIGKQMDETARTVAQVGDDKAKELLSRYGELKGKYGSFKGASDAATDRVQKNLSNRFISPSDYAMGGAASVLGALGSGDQNKDDSKMKYLIYGALGAMGNKFARTRGSALAATAANSIANALERSPGFAKQFGNLIIDAAKRGPAALATTHAVMMKSPEYKSHFQEEQ